MRSKYPFNLERILPQKSRSYCILALLQERELLRARIQGESHNFSPAASTMAAALIEEVLDQFDKENSTFGDHK